MKRLFMCLMLLAAGPVAAQQVVPCDGAARADAIAEPWVENTRAFANGDVRLALIDTVEPAAGAFQLLVLSPPYNALGERQCRMVRLDQGMGFAGIRFDALMAGYDPAWGLTFEVEVAAYDPDSALVGPARLILTLNQATGESVAQLVDFDE